MRSDLMWGRTVLEELRLMKFSWRFGWLIWLMNRRVYCKYHGHGEEVFRAEKQVEVRKVVGPYTLLEVGQGRGREGSVSDG